MTLRPGAIELRILTGSRAGQTETFDQDRVAIGRHPSNDLRFDPFKDLDVSTRHGEIRRRDDGAYIIRDNNSTNGTFVNAKRLEPADERILKNGDAVSFGANGPKVEVALASAVVDAPPAATVPPPQLPEPEAAPVPPRPAPPRQILSPTVEIMSVTAPLPPRAAPPEMVTDVPVARRPDAPPPATTKMPVAERPSSQSASTPFKSPAPPAPPPAAAARQSRAPRAPRMDPLRQGTRERVALAVAEETRGLKIAVAAVVVIAGGLGLGAWWMGHREARAADAKLAAIMASFDSSSKQIDARLQMLNDTAFSHRLKIQKDSLVRAAQSAHGGEVAAAQQSLQRHEQVARAIGDMDFPAVQRSNDDAIVFIRTEFGRGKPGLEATGFSVAPHGFIVTNRHVVQNGTARATKISVKFANTSAWVPAYFVRSPADTSVDLALVQVDDQRKLPIITGVSAKVDAPVGAPIASLGFPDGSELPMDGANAKTTLTLGTISKLTNDLVQIDSYASHGSSGSPVFDEHNHVVGVIFGGAPGSGGRIVYAVPAGRIVELVKSIR